MVHFFIGTTTDQLTIDIVTWLSSITYHREINIRVSTIYVTIPVSPQQPQALALMPRSKVLPVMCVKTAIDVRLK